MENRINKILFKYRKGDNNKPCSIGLYAVFKVLSGSYGKNSADGHAMNQDNIFSIYSWCVCLFW